MKVKHLLAIAATLVLAAGAAFYWYNRQHEATLWSASMMQKTVGQVTVFGPPKDPFKKPVGVAVDKFGRVYVADSDNHRIRIFDQNWQLVRQFGKLGPGREQFAYPVAVALDSVGEVFVSEIENNRVQVVSNQGKFIRWFPKNKTDLKEPSALCIDGDDQVYVFDRGDQKIKVFDRDGNFIRDIGLGINQPGGLNQHFRFVMGLAVLKDGPLVVSDSGNRCVKIFDPKNGKLQEEIKGNMVNLLVFQLPRGVAPIGKDKFAVVDTLARKVYVISHKSQGWQAAPLKYDFVLPDGVAYYQGKLYVTDRGSDSIEMFSGI